MLSDSEDESAVDKRTWEKMAGALQREGYREGVAAGREEAFQKGFDRGFKTGFSSGSKLAYINGFLRFVGEHEKLKHILEENGLWPALNCNKPSRGACVICPLEKERLTKEDMAQAEIPLERSIESVIEEQEERILQLKNKADSMVDKMKEVLSTGCLEHELKL